MVTEKRNVFEAKTAVSIEEFAKRFDVDPEEALIFLRKQKVPIIRIFAINYVEESSALVAMQKFYDDKNIHLINKNEKSKSAQKIRRRKKVFIDNIFTIGSACKNEYIKEQINLKKQNYDLVERLFMHFLNKHQDLVENFVKEELKLNNSSSQTSSTAPSASTESTVNT